MCWKYVGVDNDLEKNLVSMGETNGRRVLATNPMVCDEKNMNNEWVWKRDKSYEYIVRSFCKKIRNEIRGKDEFMFDIFLESENFTNNLNVCINSFRQ